MDAEVLPVDAHTQAVAPSATATEIASVMPRSLKDPVGLSPSTFSHTAQPVLSDSQGDSTSGVPPSPRVITGVSSVTGSQGRYSSTTPRHWCARAGAPRAAMSVMSRSPLRPA